MGGFWDDGVVLRISVMVVEKSSPYSAFSLFVHVCLSLPVRAAISFQLLPTSIHDCTRILSRSAVQTLPFDGLALARSMSMSHWVVWVCAAMFDGSCRVRCCSLAIIVSSIQLPISSDSAGDPSAFGSCRKSSQQNFSKSRVRLCVRFSGSFVQNMV